MTGPLKLDRIDINILAHLQRNGRVTNVDLADAVSLSPSPCLLRVKRLEKAGYITGYNAHIDIAKLGETVVVFTQVTLSDHHREDFAKFEAGIGAVDRAAHSRPADCWWPGSTSLALIFWRPGRSTGKNRREAESGESGSVLARDASALLRTRHSRCLQSSARSLDQNRACSVAFTPSWLNSPNSYLNGQVSGSPQVRVNRV